MDETASTLGTAAERADSGLSAVERHFSQLMEDLNKHLEGVNNQVTHLLDDYAAKVKDQTADRLNVWNEQTTEFMGAMTDSVRSISAVVDEIDGKVVRSRMGTIS
jgi:ABC-type transporter Mla subunit MlaD